MKQNRPILANSSSSLFPKCVLHSTHQHITGGEQTEPRTAAAVSWCGTVHPKQSVCVCAKAVAVEITAPSSGTLKTNSHSQRQTHAGKECVKRENGS